MRVRQRQEARVSLAQGKCAVWGKQVEMWDETENGRRRKPQKTNGEKNFMNRIQEGSAQAYGVWWWKAAGTLCAR